MLTVHTPPLAATHADAVMEIFEEHFRALASCDRYRSSLELVDPRLKRLASGLRPEQIAVLFGAELTHINYPTFKALCERMRGLQRLSIVETGSSAHGTNSSALFAQIALRSGGRFVTIDLNPQASANASQLFRVLGAAHCCTALCGDSVAALRALRGTFNVVYLDSYDLMPERFVESERHGLAEFQALLEQGLLDGAQSYILIDDTPRSVEIFASQVDEYYLQKVREHVMRHGRLPGKGALVAQAVAANPDFEILSWEYQLLLKFSSRSGHPPEN